MGRWAVDFVVLVVDNCATNKGRKGGVRVLFDEIRWAVYCFMKDNGIRGDKLGPFVPLRHVRYVFKVQLCGGQNIGFSPVS